MINRESVKFYRKWRKMTQGELAEAANLSESYIAKIESGKRQAGREGIERIAEALHVPVTLLMDTGDCPLISDKCIQLAQELEACTPRELEVIWDTVLSLKKSLEKYRIVKKECVLSDGKEIL